MKLFTPLYEMVFRWAKHEKAPWYLGGMSFAESSFFPIPPDVMLMPMSLAKPEKAMWYAWITTVFSTLGGLFGYLIGAFLFASIEPWIIAAGYQPHYFRIVDWFAEYGFWIMFIAGFSPLPYKMFTLTAGATGMALVPFLVASAISRGARFFLVAYLMKVSGEKYEPLIRKWVEWLGWLVVGLVVLYLMLR